MMSEEIVKQVRHCIEAGDIDGLKRLVTTVDDIPDGFDILHFASYKQQHAIIRYLIESVGMDADTRAGYNDATPLYQLGYGNDTLTTMRLLIDLGADVNAVTTTGEPVIFEHIRGNNLGGLEILKENGAGLDVVTPRGTTALMTAVWMSNLTITAWLLENGADPGAKDEDGLNLTKFRDSAAQRYVVQYCKDNAIELEDSKRLIPLVQLKKWLKKSEGQEKIEVRLDGHFAAIPEEFLQHPEIQILGIYNNMELKSLSGILSALPNLEELYISNLMSLEEIPKEIGQLKKLKKFEIGQCSNVHFLPDEICELTSLEHLAVSLRYLSYLPSEIGNLINLRQLHVYEGAMQFTPGSIIKLKNLTHLTLSNQDLDLSEMDIIFHFPLLKELDLQNNAFETIPRRILELKHLKKFLFKGNPIVNPPIKQIKGGFKGLKQYFLDNPE